MSHFAPLVAAYVLEESLTFAPKSTVRILFRPQLSKTSEDLLGLGVLVQHLRNAVATYEAAKESARKRQNRLESVSELSMEEERELSEGMENLSQDDRRKRMKARLMELRDQDLMEQDFSLFTAENTLFVLWKHVDWYLNHCEPVTLSRVSGVCVWVGVGLCSIVSRPFHPTPLL
jgi:hypothetical protein